MSLPIQLLRDRLRELIRQKRRGYMAALAQKSGISDATIHRIAYGPQEKVTYNVWRRLCDVAPELPAPLSIDKTEAPEKQYFIAALKHLISIDKRFQKVEDLSLSVGVGEKAIKGLLRGDVAYMLNEQQQHVVAHAFGLSLAEFLSHGKSCMEDLRNLESTGFLFENETIMQLITITKKLDENNIKKLRAMALDLLITQMDEK